MKKVFGIVSLIFTIFATFNAMAAPDMQLEVARAQAVGAFAVGIGSEVVIKADDVGLSGPGIFLGRAVTPDGKSSLILVLNEKTRKVNYIDVKHFAARENQLSRLQSVLNPFEQAGGTCTGYALYDYLQQLRLSGFKGTGLLSEKLATEKGRTTLLVDNINEYYLTPQHRYSIRGILDKYGRDFGFKCNSYSSENFDRVRDRILSNLAAGAPVVISFNLGPDMYNTPFPLFAVDNKVQPKMDDRVWIPRKKGERNSGGHSIVFAGSFEFQNKTYLVTIDSDWSEPRLWDLEAFLNERTVLEEVELITCKGE